MSGFLRIGVQGTYLGQQVVNTFDYRSADWPWVGVGNPFADVLKVLQDFWVNCGNEYKSLLNANFQFEQLQGTAYTDGFAVATPQPVIYTLNTPGTMPNGAGALTVSPSLCCTLGFIMGDQHHIIGSGTSLRNRGYVSLGPVTEGSCTTDGHLTSSFVLAVEALAQKLDDTLLDVPLTASFIPIRFHGKKVKNLLTGHWGWQFLNYSDVVGYRLPHVVSWRKSRRPEA